MIKVLVIAGVTGAGKSRLGVALAHRLNGEIISADSVAVYHELNVGSAKPTINEQEGVPHHLINVTNINTPYNVARFQKEGRACIEEIHSRGKLPIIVGGTGLYINALLRDYQFEEERTLSEVDERLSNEELYRQLQEVDPESAQTIHINNRQRMIRALQINNSQGKTKASSNQAQKNILLYDACILFLQGDREMLYQRINNRVDEMIENGLLDEVKTLQATDPAVFNLQSMQAIGYREFAPYFEGTQSLEATIELIKQNTRRFAKRQITWFKHQTPSVWVDVFAPDMMIHVNNAIEAWEQSISQEI
ncbi:tRNA (adenosine(37)-N6)-dimethylallyltransferase MiaA [Erysipelothrix sp. HDW6C]|uniref:tRNA (adenosine(37)-N6)-dimethylallyltransferase MiaA n=1 Tax=Erysipelothrix sp. HDW6C TaxID=2714930 RepID=UPI00140E1B9A|nr:tRNA (adenosine(37)-N6)-dimethylallyltransferase MiaA [Erysipelothrix sp. HDW6C]QIK69099.1 tRNA (adenosine(37)-N6)-dimethylallyltransferase MiaA [Erysipelothrix sp. HDW6C]